MKKTNQIFLALLFLIGPVLGHAQVPTPVQPSSAERLKQTMIQFQLLVSKMQMLKDQTPVPWPVVNQNLQLIGRNVQNMQKFDSQGSYGPYLEKISSIVNEMGQMAAKQDPTLFTKIPSLTQSCFQCHQTHGAKGIEDYKH